MAGTKITKVDGSGRGGHESTLDFIPSEMTSLWQVPEWWGNVTVNAF